MRLLCLVAACLVLALAPARAQPARDLPDIVAPLLGAVVNITVLKAASAARDGTGAQRAAAWRAERSHGSGFIIDPSGLIVTNRHVVAGGFKVTVTLHDERQFPAQVLASNAMPDLALLRIEAPAPLPTVAWGDSDALRLGETVIAIGNPLGLATSITVGVVSALNRNVASTPIDDFIQTDAPINQGNSGGPLFNQKGEVVGVNWAIITPNQQSGSVGLGLAIPASTAALAVGQMRRHGRLQAGYPGFLLQPISPAIAEVLGLPGIEGGIVTETDPDGPGYRAGLREGDVVLRIGGRRVPDARAMLRQFSEFPPGSEMPLQVWRDGTIRELAVRMVVFPPDWDPAGSPALAAPGARGDSATLGLRLSPLDEATRRSFGVATARPGLVVEGVAPYSTGAELGLARGDLVLRVGRVPVATVEAFAAALSALRGERGTLLQVEAQGAVKWIVLPPR
jgi:serine protease Do